MATDFTKLMELQQCHSHEAFHRMGYHPVSSERQKKIYETNRNMFMGVFDYVQSIGNPSHEQGLALTHLQEALMWLNAHVACNRIGADETDE